MLQMYYDYQDYCVDGNFEPIEYTHGNFWLDCICESDAWYDYYELNGHEPIKIE